MNTIKKTNPVLNLDVSKSKNTNETNDLKTMVEKAPKCETEYVLLGNKVKELRIEHNLSQTNLSQQLGVTSTYVGLIERGKRGGADEFLLKLESFFKLKHKTLLNLRDTNNSEIIAGEQQKQKEKQIQRPNQENKLQPEHKTIPNQYPTYIHDFVDNLLFYGEDYTKEKLSIWINELREEYLNQLTPYNLEEVKQHVIAVKQNWFEEKKSNDISEEDTHIVQGYISQNDQKYLFSLQLNKYALTLNLLQSDKQSIQYFESWLGTCSISYLTPENLASIKVNDPTSSYTWFSPHVSIIDMYSYLKNLAININNVIINEHRLNWYLNELTDKDKET